MRTFLLLVIFMASVARDATAEDTQCVLERGAMVETIRAYARSDVSVLGQQGLSERVLEAMGQTQRHLFVRRSCSIAYADTPLPIGVDQPGWVQTTDSPCSHVSDMASRSRASNAL